MNAWQSRSGMVVALALTGCLAIAGSARAALVISSTEGGLDTFSAAANDVINLGSPLLAGQSNAGGSLYASDPTGIGLNNGTIYADGSYGNTEGGRTYCPANGSSITFDLSSPQDIYSVVSVSGGGQARRSQRFRLEVSTVGDPAFTTVADESQIHFVSNAGNGEMKVNIADDLNAPIGTGVDQIRVTYFDTGASLPQSMYRELDVFAYAAPATSLPQVTSANLAAHFDASNINGDGGLSDPGDGGDVDTWTDLVSGMRLNHNFPIDGKPTFIAAGAGGIGDQDTVRFEATGAGPATQDDLMFSNDMSFDAQTIFAVVTMVDNGDMLATLLCNEHAGLNIRQTTSSSPSYFSGNSADFINIQGSTANDGGTLNIDGNRRLDIPGGYGAAHVVKAERTTSANYDGFRLSDNIVADRRWNGDVAEIIAFDAKLSGDDTLRVQRYLTGKYDIAFNTALDERITESKQVAVDPFDDGSPLHVAVNFHYGGPTAGTFQGIGFDNIDLTGGTPPTGPFSLDANAATAGTTLVLNFPFTSDNGQRNQISSITGDDAATLNTVFDEFFYIGGNDHPSASMTFAGLDPEVDVFVQVLGGDGNWISTVDVLVNGTETIDWLGVADNGTTTGTASLLGFYATPDALGELQLDFSIASGNYAGIAGVIITQRVPEPGTFLLLALGGLALVPLVRRRRRQK